MFFLNQGMPKENEIVLCKVTKVLPNSVFANLEEYKFKSGMLHISEVSPGRIRNIRDYVKEGKVIICKVLKIDNEKGHIDLSLRRVSESQRRQKIDEMKKEQIAEKIVEFIAKKNKMDTKELYKVISVPIFEEYDTLYGAFEDFVDEGVSLKDLKIPQKYLKDFEEIIHQRIKPPEFVMEGDVIIKSFAPDGVKVVKEALKAAAKIKGDHDIRYKGAGKYHVTVTSNDKKDADQTLTAIGQAALDFMKKKKGDEASFVRL